MAKKKKNGNGNGSGGEHGSIQNSTNAVKMDMDYASRHTTPLQKHILNKNIESAKNTYNKASDYVGEASDYLSESASSVATTIGKLFSGGSNSSEKQTSGGTPKVDDPPGGGGKKPQTGEVINENKANTKIKETVNKATNEYGVIDNYNSDVNTSNSNDGSSDDISEYVYKDSGGG